MSEKTEITLAEFALAKRKLEAKIAEEIRKFNVLTGQKIEKCSITYNKWSPGVTREGQWLIDNGGWISVDLNTKGL
jgi:hypothetical protein